MLATVPLVLAATSVWMVRDAVARRNADRGAAVSGSASETSAPSFSR
jgi:hypothetical protein